MIALARLLALLALLAFAAAAFDPVGITFRAEPARASSIELGGADQAAVTAALTATMGAAAGAGPRVRDLVLVAREPGLDLPPGPLGAQTVLATDPLPFQPDAIELRALRRAAVGRPMALSLHAPSVDAVLEARIVVRDEASELLRETVQLTGGEPVELAFVPAREGRVAVRVEIAVADQKLVRTGELEVEAAPVVLVLEPGGVAAGALRAQGVAVELAGAMTGELGRYAAVVVGAPLILPLQDALRTAIDDGLGAFVLAPAFGRAGEPLRELLPVRPEPEPEGSGGEGRGERPSTPPPDAAPPPKPHEDKPPSGEIGDPSSVSNEPVEVDKRTIAMVLVVDRSGSMGSMAAGRTKMSYAKTSALQSAQALAEGDQVGLVTFGNKGAGRVELELTDVAQAERIRAGVERLAHGPEYTYLLAGLQLADKLLRPAKTAVKHVVVVTDGEFDTSETLALRALAYSMFREARISVTIISILSDSTPSGFKTDAVKITRDGGGQFFAIAAAETVPVFVSAEVRRSLDSVGRRPRNSPAPDASPAPPPPEPEPEPPPEPEPEQPEPPSTRLPVRAVATSPVLEPLPANWPTLGSAVPTSAPLDAQVLLVAGDAGWPLLAYGNRGLGRIGVFAADLCGDAGTEMRAEEPFPARFALWVQHVMRVEPEGEPRLIAMTSSIEPGAPTPAEVTALERLGGTKAVRAAAAPVTDVHRTVVSQLPNWAFAALGVLVLLVLAERFAVLRGRT